MHCNKLDALLLIKLICLWRAAVPHIDTRQAPITCCDEKSIWILLSVIGKVILSAGFLYLVYILNVQLVEVSDTRAAVIGGGEDAVATGSVHCDTVHTTSVYLVTPSSINLVLAVHQPYAYGIIL